jgi:iron complex outermembrane receptor protein
VVNNAFSLILRILSQSHSFAVNQQSTNRSAILPFSVQEDLSVLRVPALANSTDKTYSTNFDLTGHFDTLGLKHALLLGGDFYHVDKDYDLDQTFAFSFIDIYNPIHIPTNTVGPVYKTNQTSNTDQYGLYFQDQVKLPYNFHFTGGLRYQNIYQEFAKKYSYMPAPIIPSLSADAITQREGLVWQPVNWLSLYSNYTENFGPNEGTVYVSPSVSKSAPPSAAQQWEVGTKTEFFDGRLRATFAYYNLTKTNITTGDPNPLHAGNVILTGEVRSRGPEVDIQGEILPGWNVIATYANTDAIVTKDTNAARQGRRMYGLPRNTGSLWTTYEFQQGDLRGFKLGGGVTLRDSQLALDDQPSALDYLGNARVAGYSTVDLLAAYSLKLGKSKCTAQLNINNLLDKRYFTSAYILGQPTSSGYDSSYVSFGAPRTVMGSISIQY